MRDLSPQTFEVFLSCWEQYPSEISGFIYHLFGPPQSQADQDKLTGHGGFQKA